MSQPVLLFAIGVVAVLLFGLVSVGLVVTSRTTAAKRRATLAEPKAICEGCTHHESFHEKDHGLCKYQWVDDYGRRTGECMCQRYTGPEPLPTYLPERD